METQELISVVRERLKGGDEAGALDILETARDKAKKSDDLDGIDEVLSVCSEVAGRLKNDRVLRRITAAAESNKAFLERKQTLASGQLMESTAGQETTEAGEPEVSGRPDVEAAKARMASKWGSRRELKYLDEYLWHDEIVARMASGSLDGKRGLLVHTDRRLIFLFHGRMSQRNEDFPLDTITSISVKAGLASATITVYSGGAKHDIGAVYKDDAKAITDEIRNRIATRAQGSGPSAAAPPPPPQAAVHPNVDVLAQIKQLGELRDTGVLTDEEFANKKAELLERL